MHIHYCLGDNNPIEQKKTKQLSEVIDALKKVKVKSLANENLLVATSQSRLINKKFPRKTKVFEISDGTFKGIKN